MAYVIRMPKLGVEMETGVVLEWHVDEGEAVEEEDVLAEIESEKSVAEVAAREDGVLREIYLVADDEAPPGTPMGIVAGPDEDVSDLEAEVDLPESDGEDADADEDASEGSDEDPEVDDQSDSGPGTATAAASTETSAGTAQAATTEDGRIKASPKARKRAEEMGVDLATVAGTGPENSVVADDVADAAAASGGRTVREERELTSMRTTIAERLGQSYREAVHVTVDREVEVEAVFEAVELVEADVSITDVVLKCVSETLDDHPEFNATFDADENVHTLYEEHNVGLAVDLDGGLVTPVVHGVDAKSVGAISSARGRTTEAVLDGEYTSDDLSGGTFTVSNLGVFGSDSFTPVINPPEVAILGLNRVTERAVRTDDGLAFRRHMTFSLSFDHRVVDGADAARFLTTLDEYLEDAPAVVGAA
ncbi:dihydrolipoamide acetyltransferase family protein [Halorussus halobius]|uniref:dihydrolipoamide acetyltransferase family protein n=1 Tax=Halorussus halobius TaxID=1710537 RepID=UPI001092B4AB|nr:dihydrolipoamide acetyltransferase family protein [Halorussus halobius]